MEYANHMKRTVLMLDEALLENAARALGAKTPSAAVNAALAEVLRVRKIESLTGFFGRLPWEGDLAEMRQDAPQRLAGVHDS